jgi:hypothetical protein
MTTTAATKLKALMKRAGITFRGLARRAGYAGASSIQTHLAGSRDYLTADVAIRLGRALDGLGTPPLRYADVVRQLAGIEVADRGKSASLDRSVAPAVPSRPLPVVAAVQAGAWQVAETWGEQQYTVTVPVPPQWAAYDLVGIEVRGPSMDRLYPPGTVLICVSYLDLGREPRHGERVIVQRFRGSEVEATCKEIRRDGDGVVRLWPLSTHPDHQAPIRLVDGAGADEIRVTHRVVAAIVSEPA